jgi:hypothetical protein
MFQATPESLNHDIINPAALTLHTDFDVGRFQYVGKSVTGKLSSLISIKDLWSAITLMASSKASIQKSVAIVLDNRHDKIFRLCQSIAQLKVISAFSMLLLAAAFVGSERINMISYCFFLVLCFAVQKGGVMQVLL